MTAPFSQRAVRFWKNHCALLISFNASCFCAFSKICDPQALLRIKLSFEPASYDLTLWNLKPSLVQWNDLMILMMFCFVKSQSSFYREGHIVNDICKVLVISESSKSWVQLFLKIVPSFPKFCIFALVLTYCKKIEKAKWKRRMYMEERKAKILLST